MKRCKNWRKCSKIVVDGKCGEGMAAGENIGNMIESFRGSTQTNCQFQRSQLLKLSEVKILQKGTNENNISSSLYWEIDWFCCLMKIVRNGKIYCVKACRNKTSEKRYFVKKSLSLIRKKSLWKHHFGNIFFYFFVTDSVRIRRMLAAPL